MRKNVHMTLETTIETIGEMIEEMTDEEMIANMNAGKTAHEMNVHVKTRMPKINEDKNGSASCRITISATMLTSVNPTRTGSS